MEENNVRTPKFCPACGHPQEPGKTAKFCPYCGQNMMEYIVPAEESAGPEEMPEREKDPAAEPESEKLSGTEPAAEPEPEGSQGQPYEQPGYEQQGQPYEQPGYEQQGQLYGQPGYEQQGQPYGQQHNQSGPDYDNFRDPNMVYPEDCRVGPAPAAAINFVIPGLSYLLNGQTAKGIIFIIAWVLSWCCWWVVAVAIMIFCAVDAYLCAQKLRKGEPIQKFGFF